MKYKIIFAIFLATSALLLVACFPKKNQTSNIVLHKLTADFRFQENLRSLEITVANLAAKKIGKARAEQLYIQGWTAIISAAFLLNQGPDISKKFQELLHKELDQVLFHQEVVLKHSVLTNVLESALKIKTYKEFSGLESKRISIENAISRLNTLVQKHELKFALNKDSRIYLEISPEFTDELWLSDFPKELERVGNYGFERNFECPHVTLIGSAALTLIKEKCFAENREQGRAIFDAFILTLLDNVNRHFKVTAQSLIFTGLVLKHAESYALFEKVIMAQLSSPTLVHAMNYFVLEVEKRFQLKIRPTPPNKYHVTVAIKPRVPAEVINLLTIEDLIEKTGLYSNPLKSVIDSQKQFSLLK